MLFEGIILSIIIGYIRKGRLRHLENLSIKLWYLISVAFLVQTIALRMTQLNDSMFYTLHILSYIIIMIVCYLNKKQISIVLLGIGNLLNFIVIAFNSGKMPVKVPEFIINPYFDRGHTLMVEATKVPIFGDLFLLDLPIFGVRVFSVGDVFLVVGSFLLIQYGMLLTNNRSNGELDSDLKST